MSKPVILGADGKPAPKVDRSACPGCGADRSKRVASGGFGEPHDVCRECGYEWQELTV